jgi:hypothetical protein
VNLRAVTNDSDELAGDGIGPSSRNIFHGSRRPEKPFCNTVIFHARLRAFKVVKT